MPQALKTLPISPDCQGTSHDWRGKISCEDWHSCALSFYCAHCGITYKEFNNSEPIFPLQGEPQ